MNAIQAYNSELRPACNDRFARMWQRTYIDLAVASEKQILHPAALKDYAGKIYSMFGHWPEKSIYDAWQMGIDNAGDGYGNFSYAVLVDWIRKHIRSTIARPQLVEEKPELTAEQKETQALYDRITSRKHSDDDLVILAERVYQEAIIQGFDNCLFGPHLNVFWEIIAEKTGDVDGDLVAHLEGTAQSGAGEAMLKLAKKHDQKTGQYSLIQRKAMLRKFLQK